MFPSSRASSLLGAISACCAAATLVSCQSVKTSSAMTHPAQPSEVIYASAPPRPHEFKFEALPPGYSPLSKADGPGMECLHHVATSLAIAGRIPLAVGAGVVACGMSGYHAKAGLCAAGYVLGQPLP